MVLLTQVKRSLSHIATPALAALIAVNAAVYIVMAICFMCGNDVSGVIGLAPSLKTLAIHPWTLISYSFAQANILQLIFNMLWLYGFGRMLLMRCSQRCLLKLYAAGAVTGGIIYISAASLFESSAPWLLMGSSAAVLSIAVAVAVMMPDMEVTLPLFGPTKIKWIVGIVVAIFCIGLSTPNAGGNLAHIGGAAAGGAGAVMLKRRNAHGHSDEFDRLTDKIKRTGYDALSSKEKRRFFELSSKRR